MADPHAPSPNATPIDQPETATPETDIPSVRPSDTRTPREKIAALYTRPDLRPLLYDERLRLPPPAVHDTAGLEELIRQYLGDAPSPSNDIDAEVDAAFRVFEAASPAPANDVAPPDPVEVDLELDAALIDYLGDAPAPANDVEPAPDGRYAYTNEDAIRTPILPPRTPRSR